MWVNYYNHKLFRSTSKTRNTTKSTLAQTRNNKPIQQIKCCMPAWSQNTALTRYALFRYGNGMLKPCSSMVLLGARTGALLPSCYIVDLGLSKRA